MDVRSVRVKLNLYVRIDRLDQTHYDLHSGIRVECALIWSNCDRQARFESNLTYF
jgi:hypothetical protein